MKKIKKLSVVLIITALFSASFTSCIDNEVSPLVQAIYASQATLIEAQTAVQNAEATLLAAQAETELAQAASLADLTAAQVLQLIADANFTDAQSAMLAAEAESLADLTAAQVLQLIADANFTDAQSALLFAQTQALQDITLAEIEVMLAAASDATALNDAQIIVLLAAASDDTAYNDARIIQILADAGYTEARARELQARTDAYIAQEAYYASIREQDLIRKVAETELAVEKARLDLLYATEQFNYNVANLLRSLRQNAQYESAQHASDYNVATNNVATLKGERLALEANIAITKLYQKTVGTSTTSWDFYIAGLEADLLVKQGELAADIQFVADANAYIADPANLESQVEDVKVLIDAKQAEIDAKQAEIDVLLAEDLQIDADIASAGTFDTFITDYEALVSKLEGDGTETAAPVSGLNGNLAYYTATANELTTNTIPDLMNAIADYAGTKISLENAVSDQEAVIGDATSGLIKGLDDATTTHSNLVDDLGTSLGTPTASDALITTTPLTAYEVLWNTQVKLAVVEADIANLFASYQASITSLSAAQATYDGGSGFDTVVTGNAVISAENALGTKADATQGTAWGDYNYWFGVWNADNNGDTVFDNASPMNTSGFTDAYANTFVGNHTDALTSYATAVALTEQAPVGSNLYIPTALNPTLVASDLAGITALDVAAVVFTDAEITAAAPTLLYDVYGNVALVGGGQIKTAAQTHVIYTAPIPLVALGDAANIITYYIDVEADDVVETNIDLVNYMIAQLGNELPATTSVLIADKKGTSDAYAVLWDAQIDDNIAQAGVAAWYTNSGLEAAQQVFDDQKYLYENELTILGDAQTAVSDQEAVIGDATSGLIKDIADALAIKNGLAADLGTDLGTPVAGDTYETTTAPAVLDAYQVLWNAKLAVADFMVETVETLTASKVQAEADLVTATNMISEINILIVRLAEDISALTADYEALIATPLYAGMQVRIKEIADEIQLLTAEKSILVTEKANLNSTKSGLEAALAGFENGAYDADYTVLKADILAAESRIAGYPLTIAEMEAGIQAAQNGLAQIDVDIAKLEEELVDLNAEIIAMEAQVAAYKALLDASLAQGV